MTFKFICYLDEASYAWLHQEDALYLEVPMTDILAMQVGNGVADLEELEFVCFFT